MTMRQYIRRRVGLALVTASALVIAVSAAMLPGVASGNVNPLLGVAAFGFAAIPGH